MKNVLSKPTNVTIASFSFSSLDIDYSNLTRLDLQDAHFNACVEVLHKAHALEYLRIIGLSLGIDTRIPGPPRKVVHRQLQTLEFDEVNDRHLKMIRPGIISLPNLQHLRLLPKTSFHSRPVTALTSASHSIQQVYIDIDGLLEDQIRKSVLPVLGTMPEVTMLRLRGRSLDYILSLLVQDKPTPSRKTVFLPNLETLHFDTENALDWTLIPRIFVSARQRTTKTPIRPLTRFHAAIVRRYSNGEDEIFNDKGQRMEIHTAQTLKALQEEGLDISILYRGGSGAGVGVDLIDRALIQ